MDDIINNVIARIMADYCKDRDEAVASLDIETFKAFMNKWRDRGIVPECFTLASDDVLEISIRKMCLHIPTIPEEIKNEAEDWLLERGYDLDLE